MQRNDSLEISFIFSYMLKLHLKWKEIFGAEGGAEHFSGENGRAKGIYTGKQRKASDVTNNLMQSLVEVIQRNVGNASGGAEINEIGGVDAN